MIVLVSDTHCRDRPRFADQLATDLSAADTVVHAGDFTTETVLEAVQEHASRLVAVHGNADTPAVKERLPSNTVTTVETVDGLLRIAVVHRRDGGMVGLRMFGRSVDADLVVTGHTHRPAVHDDGDITIVNPGSHADPRGNRPGYAVIDPDTRQGQILTPSGEVLAPITLPSQ